MSICIQDLYDYDLIENCRACKNTSIKPNFNKNETTKDGYRSECRSCFKEYYYNNRDHLLNNMKNSNRQKREKMNLFEKIREKLISTTT